MQYNITRDLWDNYWSICQQYGYDDEQTPPIESAEEVISEIDTHGLKMTGLFDIVRLTTGIPCGNCIQVDYDVDGDRFIYEELVGSGSYVKNNKANIITVGFFDQPWVTRNCVQALADTVWHFTHYDEEDYDDMP